MASWEVADAVASLNITDWQSGEKQSNDERGQSIIAEGDSAAAPRDSIDPRAGNEEYMKEAKARGWSSHVAVDSEAHENENNNNTEWHGTAPRYEWADEFGEVAPRVPQLEAMLFGGDFRMRVGQNIENLAHFEVVVEGPTQLQPIRTFADAGLHPVMLDNIELCGYKQPTPIQAYCIPYALQGTDMVAVAQTGSGKTAAYMIPVLSRLMGKAKKLCAARPNTAAEGYDPRLHRVRAEPLVVIVVPTRELAIQIFDEARRLCYRSMLRPCVAYGGLPMGQCIEELGKGCDIFIATPGRLVDFMDRPSMLSMKRVKFTIVDEADELLNNDWEVEFRKIMAGGDMNDDADHVFMLFSATFPKAALEAATDYLADDRSTIKIGRAGSSHRNIQQEVIWVEQNKKQEALWDLLLTLEPRRTMIFCNSRGTVDILDDMLHNRDVKTTSIHSQRSQREREDALRSFRTGRTAVLVATGVSARGWDIEGIAYVINYDLPSGMHGGIHEYVHRIGRTARIGHVGKAFSFYNQRNEDVARELTNTLLECGCEVPHFLTEYVHEDGKPHFEEEEQDNDAGIPVSNDIAASNAGEGEVVAGWGAADEQSGHQEVVTWGAADEKTDHQEALAW